MNFDLLLERIDKLCARKGVNRTTAFIESEVGKNFKSNLKTAGASDKNLALLAKYFNVSVEYLTGEEDENAIASRAMGEVIEWLEDNEYEISEDENSTLTISKSGKSCYYANADFVTESLAIKATAEEGFELAMLDWENRNFNTSCELSEDEVFLVKTFRQAGAEGRERINQLLLNIRDEEEKKSKSENKKAIG